MNNLKIVEGVAGYYFYHLSNNTNHKSLCGEHTMQTGIPLSFWGKVSHLNERYCKNCDKMARENVLPVLNNP